MVPGVVNSVKPWLFLALSIVVFGTPVEAQTAKPPLERVVTIAFANQKPDAALDALATKAGCTFSYSPSIIQDYATLTINAVAKTVREILNQLFEGQFQAKEKGNYIILTKATVPKKPSAAPLVITGYVVNATTREKISDVSIYDKKTLVATLSNSFGYFKLTLDKPARENFIIINKKRFHDSTIVVRSPTASIVTIALTPEQPVVDVKDKVLFDTAEDSNALTVPIAPPATAHLKEREVNMQNIKDTLYRKYQVSLVPFVGTNLKLSGNVINEYSLNIFGGYSLGTTKVEIGGFFNVARGDVSHFQLAGFFNAVNGNVSGAQVAGYINVNRGTFDGVQLAGNVNLNMHRADGYQFSGLVNVNAESSRGAMFAGLANVQLHDYKGTQVAGLLNITTRRIKGVQLAGLVNFASRVKGIQIGILNFADSLKGVPIGLLSFVRSGYHQLEASADEIFYTNIAFRSGVHQFYNILTAGIKPIDSGDGENYWTVGYGVGSAPRISKKLSLNFDLTANQVSKGNFTQAINLLNKLYVGVDFQVAKHFSITTGATLNGYLTDTNFTQYAPLFSDYQPNILYDADVGNNSHLQMWWGAKVGVRFL